MNRNLLASLIVGVCLLALPLLAFAAVDSERLAAPAGGTIWYVDAASGSDANSCLTPGAACATIGEAVGRATDGDTIQIAAGVYPEYLDLNTDLLLLGEGPANTILDGENSHRVLQLSGIADITASSLAIRGGWQAGNEGGGAIRNLGRLTLDNVHVYDSASENFGGAIYNNGDLIVQNSEVTSNTTAGTGGAMNNWYGGSITVTHSLIADNDAAQGGAIFNLATVRLEDSTLRGNSVAQFGGAVTVYNGEVTLERVTVVGNEAVNSGGGLYVGLGAMHLINTTVSGNQANHGGGLAVLGTSAIATILNSTFSANATPGAGVTYGGIYSSGALTITNSLVAGNDGRQCLAGGDWASGGHNLSSDGYCDFDAPGDLEFTDPLLAPLGDYGGPTETHALWPGSAAIDAGDDPACPAEDQREVARPVDGDNSGAATCDIGAYEARSALSVADVSVVEGDAGTVPAVFTVTLAPTSTKAVTVTYATVDGTANAGSDYTAGSGVLTFAAGEAETTVTILVSGDTDDEPDQTFTLNLGPAGNADIVDGEAVATIVDDDGLSSLSVADVAVDEGNSGTTTASFVVTLSPAAAGPVMVDVATADDTAVAGSDYTSAGSTLTFLAGETSKVVDVAVIGDVVDEGSAETFRLHLSNAIGANIADGEGTGTILDDDTAQVSLGPRVEVVEGDSGTTPAVFAVTLSVPTAFPVTVEFYTQSAVGGDQFAVAGEDYEAISGTLTFDPGETSQTITVLVLGDTASELNETYAVYLINASPITIYAGASGGTIWDDDQRMFVPFVFLGGP